MFVNISPPLARSGEGPRPEAGTWRQVIGKTNYEGGCWIIPYAANSETPKHVLPQVGP